MQQPSGNSFSTIFHCNADFLICSLRLLQGVISAVMTGLFIKGYLAITKERHNQITQQDSSIYLLALSQTLILAVYYLLFQQFFVLATIRNLLIWININLLEVLAKIYWLNAKDHANYSRFMIGLNILRVANFITWFVFAVGHGSSLHNTSFNLGYNCRLTDWIILSGFLLAITAGELYFMMMIFDRLNWQHKNSTQKSKIKSIEDEKFTMSLLVSFSAFGAIIMFIWDYLAYMIADQDIVCEVVFSGNTFFRKILCFILKILSMQVVPCIAYYTIYYKRRHEFIYTLQQQTKQIQDDTLEDPLYDRAYSELNRSITSSRGDSRADLFSNLGNRQNMKNERSSSMG